MDERHKTYVSNCSRTPRTFIKVNLARKAPGEPRPVRAKHVHLLAAEQEAGAHFLKLANCSLYSTVLVLWTGGGGPPRLALPWRLPYRRRRCSCTAGRVRGVFSLPGCALGTNHRRRRRLPAPENADGNKRDRETRRHDELNDDGMQRTQTGLLVVSTPPPQAKLRLSTREARDEMTHTNLIPIASHRLIRSPPQLRALRRVSHVR